MIEKAVMKKIIDRQDYDLLAEQLKQIKQLIDKVRAERWPEIDFSADAIGQISRITGRHFNLSPANRDAT
jgi:outer membrane protein TolC